MDLTRESVCCFFGTLADQSQARVIFNTWFDIQTTELAGIFEYQDFSTALVQYRQSMPSWPACVECEKLTGWTGNGNRRAIFRRQIIPGARHQGAADKATRR